MKKWDGNTEDERAVERKEVEVVRNLTEAFSSLPFDRPFCLSCYPLPCLLSVEPSCAPRLPVKWMCTRQSHLSLLSMCLVPDWKQI